MKDEKDRKTTSIDDWMVRIAFAEAGEPDLGFKETGIDPDRKTKLALDKIMVVREEAALLKGAELEKGMAAEARGLTSSFGVWYSSTHFSKDMKKPTWFPYSKYFLYSSSLFSVFIFSKFLFVYTILYDT